jgi:hypothetical protein
LVSQRALNIFSVLEEPFMRKIEFGFSKGVLKVTALLEDRSMSTVNFSSIVDVGISSIILKTSTTTY